MYLQSTVFAWRAQTGDIHDIHTMTASPMIASLLNRQLALVNSEQFADVLFKVGAAVTPIYGHRAVLANCDYFAKMFTVGMAETKADASPDNRIEVRLPDADPATFL